MNCSCVACDSGQEQRFGLQCLDQGAVREAVLASQQPRSSTSVKVRSFLYFFFGFKMEDLLNKQQQVLANIEQIYTNFKKDGADRKTPDYISRRLETLESHWQEFQINHGILCGYGAEQHPYFTGKKFDLAKDRYDNIRAAIQNYQPSSRPTTPVIKAATLFAPPTSTSIFKPAEQKTQGTSSKTEELLRKQASNFRAFQRTISAINLDPMAEKWELDDLLRTVQSRWSTIDALHWEIDGDLEGTNQEYENMFSHYEQSYNRIKTAINKQLHSVAHREHTTHLKWKFHTSTVTTTNGRHSKIYLQKLYTKIRPSQMHRKCSFSRAE